jgi:outer membrane lipoprotein-sorting protein
MSRASAAAAALLCVSCAPRPPVVSLPPRDPAALLARLRREEDRVRSLRARFESSVRGAGRERKASGVLVVRKPDRFRLRLFLPFGWTVLDYLDRGGEAWVADPFRDAATDPAARFDLLSRRDLGAAFLRGADAFPGTCAAVHGRPGRVEVTCRSRSGGRVLRTLELDSRSGSLRREVTYDEQGPELAIEYDDVRPADGVELPYDIRIHDPRRHVSLEIRVSRYDVNPDLPERLFEPAPSSVRVAR